MNGEFFRLARAAHGVSRFHTMPTIGHQSVAEHSYGVAMLVIWLTDGAASANLMKAALYHDLPEHFLGDIPAPAKWDYPDLKAAAYRVEEQVHQRAGTALELDQTESDLLKIADMLELICYCAEQLRLGNRNAYTVFLRGVTYLAEKCPRHPKAWELIAQLQEEIADVRR